MILYQAPPPHRKRFARWLAGLCLTLLGSLPAYPQTPTAMPPVVSYQGFLTTPAGAPLSGKFTLTFRLYDEAVTGNALWEETHARVTINRGIFSVFLGAINPLLAAPGIREFDRPFYLGVSINGAAELTPRLALASLPVAAQAKASQASVRVDCGNGESIGQAIERAPVGGRLTVNIVGDCVENLVIERDFVTLDGGATATLTGITPNPHTGNAVVFLDGVRSIEIKGLTIAGPAGDTTGMDGLRLAMVSSATLSEGTVLENHDGNGALVTARSQLDLFDSFVRGNRRNGVYARDGSSLDTANTDIRDNQRAGVFLHRRSSGGFTSSTVTGNGDGVEELGFAKSALFLDEGSQARIFADNTFRSDAANVYIGAAITVSRGSSLRFASAGTLVENTAFNAANREAFSREPDAGVAIDVEIDSVARVSGGTVTIRGWVLSYNLTTVDLRQVALQGHLGVFGLDANVRLRDQSGEQGRVSLTGDIIMEGGALSLRVPPNTQAARIDGNIDCKGRSGVPSNALFQDPEDGYLNCFGIQTDVALTIAESADPIGVNGSVVYDVSVTNIKRSPAVEARSLSVQIDLSSPDSFTVTGADTSASAAAGVCNIDDAGTFVPGVGFVGSVSCFFDAIGLSAGLTQITVSSAQADLSVNASVSVGNGDLDFGNNNAAESTTVQ